jgi:hypothetical protein
MTLQFERKYSTQGSGAPCHVSFGFFSLDFSGLSCQDFRWTLSQILRLNLRLGGYFHISFGFKTRRVFLEAGPRARRSLLEGRAPPRTGRSPPEGGVHPRARRSLLEGIFERVALVGR